MLPIYHHEPQHLLTAPWMYTEFREDLVRPPGSNKFTKLTPGTSLELNNHQHCFKGFPRGSKMIQHDVSRDALIYSGSWDRCLMIWLRANASLCWWVAAMAEQALRVECHNRLLTLRLPDLIFECFQPSNEPWHRWVSFPGISSSIGSMESELEQCSKILDKGPLNNPKYASPVGRHVFALLGALHQPRHCRCGGRHLWIRSDGGIRETIGCGAQRVG